ncbi:MAG: tetratricopeptide repeat protein [Thermogutta sp.]
MAKAELHVPGWVYLALVVAAAYVPPWLLSWRSGSRPTEGPTFPATVSQDAREPPSISRDSNSLQGANTGEAAPSEKFGPFRPDFAAEVPETVEALLEEGEAVISRLRSRHPDDADAAAAIAEYSVTRGREREAAAKSLATLQTRAAKVYSGRGDVHRAEEYLRRALSIDPGNREARRALAILYEGVGNDVAAAAVLEDWRRTESDDVTPYVLLAALYGSRRDFLRTQEVLAAAVSRFPSDPVPRAMLAKLYIDTGQKSEEAVKLAESVVAREASAVNYELLCEAYLACGRLDDAERACHLSRAESPGNPRLRHLEARIREARAAAGNPNK